MLQLDNYVFKGKYKGINTHVPRQKHGITGTSSLLPRFKILLEPACSSHKTKVHLRYSTDLVLIITPLSPEENTNFANSIVYYERLYSVRCHSYVLKLGKKWIFSDIVV